MYNQLSVTILDNYGKCHPYHSLILIESVFKSLSNNSIKEMLCIIGLSCLFTSNEILLLDTE